MNRLNAPWIPNPEELELAPALKNPAVAHCHQIWDRVFRKTLKIKKSMAIAHVDAADAYRLALPPLDSPENIRAFITCIGFGMASGVFMEETGARLLVAAQMALRALPPRQNARPVTDKSQTQASQDASNPQLEFDGSTNNTCDIKIAL